MVGGGVEQNRSDDDIAAILATDKFGIVKLGAGYSQVGTVAIAGDKAKNRHLMATAPFGAFTAKVGCYNVEAEGTGVRTKKVGIGGEYALSKRTYLYASYGRTKKDGVAATTGFDLGMSHFL